MEQKGMLVSTLSIGVGLGIGLGLSSGLTKWSPSSSSQSSLGVTVERIEQELHREIIDGSGTGVTFEQFPYHLSDQTRQLLLNAAYFHLNQAGFSKYTRNLSPASRTVLLSGPSELYLQALAKALSHHFKAKLLLLDASDFSFKLSNKYGLSCRGSTSNRSAALESTHALVSRFITSFQKGIMLARQKSGINTTKEADNDTSGNVASPSPPTKRTTSWCFEDKLLIQALYKVLMSESSCSPIILYLRDVEKLVLGTRRQNSHMFNQMFKRLSGPVLVLGSCLLKNPGQGIGTEEDLLKHLFPYTIEVKPPEDETLLVSYKSQLEEDNKALLAHDNRNHVAHVLAANDIICDDLSSVCTEDSEILGNFVDEIVMSAISHYLLNSKDPEYRNGKLVISSNSLLHGLGIFRENQQHGKDGQQLDGQGGTAKESEQKKEEPDNEFEKRIRPDVIPANEIAVSFSDIGALDEIKESLQELIMLPLRRPEIFSGGLLQPCRGILLFGPPGTGKTMLAKAIAREAGASFINISMCTITSKWFGEDEKTVRALFSLAAKIAPTVIFVDEVDSMLRQRCTVGEHEAMRKIKNEFMTQWDGLRTQVQKRILVLGATNRPFDLDDAVIRRFERRFMVGLPSPESRERILQTLLSKEKIDDNVDLKQLAAMTEGYSGSDLRNLCMTAAYRPVRDVIEAEKLKVINEKQKDAEEQNKGEDSGAKAQGKRENTCANEQANGDESITIAESKGPGASQDEPKTVTIRPLNMDDLMWAKNQIAISYAAGRTMNELKQWNELYGEGGSRKQEQLSYFL